MKKLTRTKAFFLVLLVLAVLPVACNAPVNLGDWAGSSQPPIPEMLAHTSQDAWSAWINKLSGVEPVVIGGEPAVITTRYSYAMFTGQPNARAFDFVLEQVRAWVPDSQIEVDEYPYADAEHTYTWKNLIVTLPGTTRENEVVVLSAHLDSTVVREGNALEAAPGADDNATGAAALLEAVRLFSRYRFERTLKLIFFSGEENGLAGSRAYTADHPTDNIVAVVNMDMFGFDSNGDRCFELHVGVVPGAEEIGQTFVQSIQEYNLDLRYDFLRATATDRSDHTAFWEKGVPAVTVIQNFFEDGLPDGCQGVDGTPWYHRPGDTIDKINLTYGYDIARASLITAAKLAVPQRRIRGW